jgi:hypothetical protein
MDERKTCIERATSVHAKGHPGSRKDCAERSTLGFNPPSTNTICAMMASLHRPSASPGALPPAASPRLGARQLAVLVQTP